MKQRSAVLSVPHCSALPPTDTGKSGNLANRSNMELREAQGDVSWNKVFHIELAKYSMTNHYKEINSF